MQQGGQERVGSAGGLLWSLCNQMKLQSCYLHYSQLYVGTDRSSHYRPACRGRSDLQKMEQTFGTTRSYLTLINQCTTGSTQFRRSEKAPPSFMFTFTRLVGFNEDHGTEIEIMNIFMFQFKERIIQRRAGVACNCWFNLDVNMRRAGPIISSFTSKY